MKSKKDWTVLWWVGWIVLTILSFFVSCWFWTPFIAERVGDMSRPGVPLLWVAAVFGSWMVLLVPLIIVMYNKVDRAYEDARLVKENAAAAAALQKTDFGVRAAFLEDEKRLLPKALDGKIKKIPSAVPKGQLVTAVLKDGRRVEHVFVHNKKEILGAYGLERLTFSASDIVDIEASDLDRLPDFRTENWMRFDLK